MKDIYAKIVECFEKERFSVLATLIRLSGSGPRNVGAKLLVTEDGVCVGTIGGGLLEARVLQEAQKVFSTRSPARMALTLMGSDVAETEMLCGGEVEVFLEPVPPGNFNHLYIFKQVVEVQGKGGAGLIATVVEEDRWRGGRIPKIFIEKGGEFKGSLLGSGAIEEALRGAMDRITQKREPMIIPCVDDEGNTLDLFVEPIVSDPVLYVFGGGHVSSEIVPLAARVGFKVVVVDDRTEFADPKKFPDAAWVSQLPFEGVLEKLPVDGSTYVVIVTRGHLHDKTVLSQCLRTNAKYIGMIGSRRKRAIIYEKLLEEGFSEKDLSRVYSPIGVAIGAETPQEIAVSIVAELIKVRAGVE